MKLKVNRGNLDRIIGCLRWTLVGKILFSLEIINLEKLVLS